MQVPITRKLSFFRSSASHPLPQAIALSQIIGVFFSVLCKQKFAKKKESQKNSVDDEANLPNLPFVLQIHRPLQGLGVNK